MNPTHSTLSVTASVYVPLYLYTPHVSICGTKQATRRGCLLREGVALATNSNGSRERDTGSIGYRCSSVTYKTPFVHTSGSCARTMHSSKVQAFTLAPSFADKMEESGSRWPRGLVVVLFPNYPQIGPCRLPLSTYTHVCISVSSIHADLFCNMIGVASARAQFVQPDVIPKVAQFLVTN